MKRISFALLLFAAIAIPAAAAPNRFAGAFAHPRVPDGERVRIFVIGSSDPQTGGTTHSVTLTWTAPVISPASTCVLAGYNVKRSQSSGTEITIASPTSTTYTDTNVTAGQKYFYVVTATAGTTCTESGPSNEVTAQIPLDQIGSPTGLAASGVK